MSLHLCTLTLNARASPTTNICIDTWPNETRGNEFLRGADTRVRKAMEGVEYSTSPREWNERTLRASGSVAVERVSSVCKRNGFYDKSGGR